MSEKQPIPKPYIRFDSVVNPDSLSSIIQLVDFAEGKTNVTLERKLDAEKVELMAENVFAQSSETLKWLTEGDGTPFLDLANILHSLREPEEGGVELSIGGRIVITPENYRELTNNGAFAPGGVSSRVANATLAVARAKSRALHALEVNPQLVTMWQRFGEQKASFFIKNN